jgi:hypothetical protein
VQFPHDNHKAAVANARHQLLDYVATHPNADTCYLKSNMILTVHINALYLSEHNTRSRASAYFYLTNKGEKDFNNGTILNLASIIKHVMSLASEAELAVLYYHGYKLAIPIRTILNKMGHTQPQTPITTDNIMTQGLTVGNMTLKASKSMDQQFHWLKCERAQCQVLNLWRCGILNEAGYT